MSYQFQDKVFKEQQKTFAKLSLKKQKQILIDLLDKNMLYLNYEDIEDKKYKVEYGIDPETIKLNKKFYGE